jgi:FkbM family methyltransferase
MMKLPRHAVKRLLADRGFELRRMPPPLAISIERQITASFRYVISHYMEMVNDLFFIQIGAYDGLSNDPLHEYIRRHRWRGVLVEPQPMAFEQLKNNYRDQPQLIFERAAVGNTDGVSDFYVLAPKVGDTLSDLKQLASFQLDTIMKHNRWHPEIEASVKTIRTPVITLDTLLQRAASCRLDLLQIDAEGYDFEIIKTIDFKRFPPSIIHYEHRHLTCRSRNDCLTLLVNNGYRLNVETHDTVAYRAEFASK